MISEDLDEIIDEWCAGKHWWWRASLMLILAREWLKYVSEPLYTGWFSPLTLGIHEMGHLLFSPLGEWLTVAGGSILQAAAPLISAILFFKQPDFFAIAVCGGWLSSSLFDMATYMGDATKLELDVVTIGGQEPITPNDWRYLLERAGLLLWDQRLAGFVRFLASLLMLVSLIYAGWLLLKMKRQR
jgi:hypothetical protein